MIRRATEQDVDAIVALGREMVATTGYHVFVGFDEARVAHVTRDLIANPDAALFVAERDGLVTGMLAMLVYAHPFSGDRIAGEVVWFMDPAKRGDGVRLLKAAEAWAKTTDAVAVQMIAPTERVGDFYRAVGYAPVETAYQRRV